MTEGAHLEKARDAFARRAWTEAYEILSPEVGEDSSGEELEALADAAWWVNDIGASMDARRRANVAYLNEDAPARAAFCCWHLFYEHLFRGEPAVASGWLKRAHRHLEGVPEGLEHGFVAFAEADIAHRDGLLTEALSEAQRATEIGQREGHGGLMAMGLQMQGSVSVSLGRFRAGTGLLDESMTCVIGGEVEPFFEGWIYCYVLGACHDSGDLGRVFEWTDAAIRWCESLASGTIYHGICKIHHIESVGLRGELDRAASLARAASEEMVAWYPVLAGEGRYLAGEVLRRMGDLDGAIASFEKAHHLGCDPQPGLALAYLARGDADAAVSGLLNASTVRAGDHLKRARLLSARCEVGVEVGDLVEAGEALDELHALAVSSESPALHAICRAEEARVALARDELDHAFECARDALRLYSDLGMPHEMAQARVFLGSVARARGDDVLAGLELGSAFKVFEELGATLDARRTEALFAKEISSDGLSKRELEVLRLVATGKSNKEIALELVISENTVSRHLSNIFTKIGVSSRASATAYAFENNLV